MEDKMADSQMIGDIQNSAFNEGFEQGEISKEKEFMEKVEKLKEKCEEEAETKDGVYVISINILFSLLDEIFKENKEVKE